MKLKIYDDVKLNTELEELAVKGISKGCGGTIFEIKADVCFVCFLNGKNYGDYACCYVKSKYLTYCGANTEKQIEDFEKFKSRRDLTKSAFKVNPFYELDWVEVLVEKEEYAQKGLHKGTFASVLFDYAADDMLPVIFSDENHCDVEVSVNIGDIKLRERFKRE